LFYLNSCIIVSNIHYGVTFSLIWLMFIPIY